MTGRESLLQARLLLGDCIDRMRDLPDGCIDSIVTDPPYGLGFMGKDWDSPGGLGDHPMRRNHGTNTVNTGVTRQGGRQRTCEDFTKRQLRDARSYQSWCEEWASECLRVLQPGGFLLAFSGTRTYHRMTSGIEDAGFEVRDTIAWLYGQGFPKHHSLLKPALEPICVARKTGRGWLNTDAARIPVEPGTNLSGGAVSSKSDGWDRPWKHDAAAVDAAKERIAANVAEAEESGRWPANVVLDPEAAAMLDEQSGELTSGANPTSRGTDKFREVYGDFKGQTEIDPKRGVDVGGASRFFYMAKASQAERHEGLTVPSLLTPPDAPERNDHPTVKPIDLMRWLIRLATPDDGTVLDPFLGSGTTGIAAALEGFPFVGIERDEHYMGIAQARMSHWGGTPVEARRDWPACNPASVSPVNDRVQAAAGVNGTVVILSAWCRRCKQQAMPDRYGSCSWCFTVIVDEQTLSASDMLAQISGREPTAVLRAAAGRGQTARGAVPPRKTRP